MKKKITIQEIAKMANVSPTAVSFVLNDKEGVSEETREKVNKIIEETNYTPNRNSRRLYYDKTFNIAIVVKETSSPFNDLFYFEITKGVLKKGKEFGYNIVFTEISQDRNAAMPNILIDKDADGIICYQDMEQHTLNKIEELNIPYVVVDAHDSKNDFTAINADYEKAVYLATDYLIDNGHENIGFICSSFIPNFYLQCFSGFKNAHSEKDISINPSWIQDDATDEETSYKCMERILESKKIPTAVCSAVDIFAIGAMKCARDKGYKIPEDISFIGIDDILLSHYVEPPLTTVKIDKLKMGEIAMDLLNKKIEGVKTDSKTLEMNQLIVRESVQNLN